MERFLKRSRSLQGVKFRAIATLGKMFGQADLAGHSFTPPMQAPHGIALDVESGGSAVTETIVGIQMRDAQHLTVTTASGAQWVSKTAAHWQT